MHMERVVRRSVRSLSGANASAPAERGLVRSPSLWDLRWRCPLGNDAGTQKETRGHSRRRRGTRNERRTVIGKSAERCDSQHRRRNAVAAPLTYACHVLPPGTADTGVPATSTKKRSEDPKCKEARHSTSDLDSFEGWFSSLKSRSNPWPIILKTGRTIVQNLHNMRDLNLFHSK